MRDTTRKVDRLFGCHEPWPKSPLRRVSLTTSAAAVKLAAGVADAIGSVAGLFGLPHEADIDASWSRWHDRQAWPARPLRIGLVTPGPLAHAVSTAPGCTPVEWFRVPRGLSAMAPAAGNLDLVMEASPDAMVRVRTHVHEGCIVGWHGLGERDEAVYPSVFPSRMDVAELVLNEADLSDARLIRLLMEGVGLQARHPARLRLGDRLAGRRPTCAPNEPARGIEPYNPIPDPTLHVVKRLIDELRSVRPGARPTSAERAAARFLGAWAVTSEHVGEDARHAAAEIAARVASEEAATLYRAAAVRLEALDDEGGLALLERAVAMSRTEHPDGDGQASFLFAELGTGTPSAATTARIAVGVALVASRLEPGQWAYFREDLTDDLAHASALVGRDQDHRLILEVLRRLERPESSLNREAA